MINQHQFEQSARHFRSGRISLKEFAARVFHGDEAAPHHLNPSAASKKSGQTNARPARPRVLSGDGQTTSSLAEVVNESHAAGQPLLITRIAAETGQSLAEQFDDGKFSEADRTFSFGEFSKPRTYAGPLTVITDAEDSPITAEVCATLKWLGATVNRITANESATLKPNLESVKSSAAIVVVGGAENSLPAAVAQEVNCDVFAVPTSANPQSIEKQLTEPLLAATNGNSHVAFVGIDAGCTAGYLAASAARSRG